MKKCINLFVICLHCVCACAQGFEQSDLNTIIEDSSRQKFNGVVLIVQKSKPIYSYLNGYSDLENQTRLNQNSQFVIGSISKKITAVMVLLEYEKGHLQLDVPIKTYLPEIKMSWADTVTVHHLLTHMHGISTIDQPLAFVPGTQFDYGLANTGYRLLSMIVEKVSHQSFEQYAEGLFLRCGMNHTFHPDSKRYRSLVKGYTENAQRKLVYETESFQNAVAAGGFVSTAGDLVIWNEHLHQGKILKPETYQLMITPKSGALRQHPIFGVVKYGYGITVSTDHLLQLGQTGFAPGFVSMNFYFPQTETSVVVLENTAYATGNLKQTFSHHIRILDYIKNKAK